MRKYLCLLLILMPAFVVTFNSFSSKKDVPSLTEKNVPLIKSISTVTDMPWEYLAAIHQYEEQIHRAKRTANELPEKSLVSIRVPSHLWVGASNPVLDDTNPASIDFFGGIGKDANGDMLANSKDPTDVFHTLAVYFTEHGNNEQSIRGQIWNYYHNTISVDIISHTAKLFKEFQTVSLQKKVFPLPLGHEYSYKDTWGAPRGFGGARIHEGTDIFADYGTPVLSTCYGYVELMGWNKYGGWRIGIRDAQNTYHYFAHLGYFRKGLRQGNIVKPGEVLGAVGSSGYGPPGTAGKFPPHLHFGLYSFNGRSTYSFDPYAHLRAWERETRKVNGTKN